MTEIQRPSQETQTKIISLQKGAKENIERARERARAMWLYF